MSIFGKPFDQVTFEDVEEFAKLQRPETSVLDYKTTMPHDGLAKHIAAMSNTNGAVIIIGIQEDSHTGYPVKWEGVDDGKWEDQVWQQAANVKPYPTVHVYKTPPKAGKVFVIIEVVEGMAGPYTTTKDTSTVWMRTGNVSTPLAPADQDATERIRARRDKAAELRQENAKFSDEIFDLKFNDAEADRKQKAAQKPDDKLLAMPLGTVAVYVELSLQPYFPEKDLLGTNPRELMDALVDIQPQNRHTHFPSYNYAKPAPNGTVSFYIGGWSAAVGCDQLYLSGYINHKHDVGTMNEKQTVPHVYLNDFITELFGFITAAHKLYSKFGYAGQLIGSLKVTNAKGAAIEPVGTGTYMPFFQQNEHMAMMDSYSWGLQMTTRDIADRDWIVEQVKELMVKIAWDMGQYQHLSGETIEAVMAMLGYIKKQ